MIRVSVIVPALDEAEHISACLRAVAAQTFPSSETEVIVVVGSSSQDPTESIARHALAEMPFGNALVVRNSESSTPSNLNLGLSHASGTYVCRVDARSRIAPNHIERCVGVLEDRTEIVVVGGAQVAVPPKDSAVGLGIARALNNPLGMGGSRYRRNAASGECETVYLGFFRRRDLESAGGWSADFPTNQDFELNQRLREGGRSIWFDQEIPAGYVPRSSLQQLFQQYARFGRWKVRYWRHTGDRPQPRQMVLLGLPALSVGVALVARRACRRTGGRAMVAVGLAAALAAIERASTGPDDVPPGARVVHLAALAAVSSGWEAGVYRELCAPRAAR